MLVEPLASLFVAVPSAVSSIIIVYIFTRYKLKLKIEDNKIMSEKLKTQVEIARLRQSSKGPETDDVPPPATA